MMEYRFLTGPDDASFCRRVTEHLNDGWTLYGGPALTVNEGIVIAGQAVTREKKDAQGFCSRNACSTE